MHSWSVGLKVTFVVQSFTAHILWGLTRVKVKTEDQKCILAGNLTDNLKTEIKIHGYPRLA